MPDLSPALERAVEQRYAAALGEVARIREEHPDETAEQLANRLIRRYAKDMAVGGAVAGGAAAAPIAGMAVAAASAGVESAYSVGRLGEMIMAIGVLYGHPATSADERRAAVLAVLGMADGAAIGVSGLAARAGSRGGARLLRRLTPPPGATSTGRTRSALAKATKGRGPWSAAALVPYGIGAGVGAAGSALLARSVGRAAKEYYAARERRESFWAGTHAATPDGTRDDTSDGEDAVDGELVEIDHVDVAPADDDVVDAVVVEPGHDEPGGRVGP